METKGKKGIYWNSNFRVSNPKGAWNSISSSSLFVPICILDIQIPISYFSIVFPHKIKIQRKLLSSTFFIQNIIPRIEIYFQLFPSHSIKLSKTAKSLGWKEERILPYFWCKRETKIYQIITECTYSIKIG